MHVADYTKLFATPDELADFLMLEAGEQDRILAEFVQEGRIGQVMIWCHLPANAQNDETES
jgi:hypothetical protein